MPVNHHIYTLIDRSDDPAVDRALADALPSADEQATLSIATRLLDRRQPQAMDTLISTYHRLPLQIQQRMAADTALLARAMRQATRDGSAGTAQNIIALIEASVDLSLTYLLGDLLRRAEPPARSAAARCLLTLARTTAFPAPNEHLPPASAKAGAAGIAQLAEAIDRALDVTAEHQPAVIGALAWMLPRPCGRVLARLSRPNHPGAATLKKVMADAHSDCRHRLLLPMLRWPALRRPAATALREGGWPLLQRTLATTWLLLDPQLRAALGRSRPHVTILPSPSAATELDSGNAAALVRWLALAPFEPASRLGLLERMRQAPDPLVRLMALRVILGLGPVSTEASQPGSGEGPAMPQEAASVTAMPPPTPQCLMRFAQDPDPRVAALATRHLAGLRAAGVESLLGRLVNSPHEPVRALAAARLVPRGLDNLWQRWSQLDRAHRTAAARALAKLPFDLVALLQRRLVHPDPTCRWRAIELLRAMAVAGRFEGALVRLATDPQAKVASAAVAALGEVGSHLAVVTLEAALKHADPRVRGNAVEGLSRLRCADHVEQLLQMAREDANRPRANAIAALMQLGRAQAMPALVAMLGDARPAHRRSALWLTDHLGLVDLTRQVGELARHDCDEKVRERARAVAGRLTGSLAGAGDDPSSKARAS